MIIMFRIALIHSVEYRSAVGMIIVWLISVLWENGYSLMDYENDCVWVRVVFMLSFCFHLFYRRIMMGFHWFVMVLFEHWDSDLLL